MVNTCWKHVKSFNCKKKNFDDNQLEANYQLFHHISMNETLLPNEDSPPEGWDRAEPARFYLSQCTRMAIDELVKE